MKGEEFLSEDDAREHLEGLLVGIPDARAAEVMAQAVWVMPPWSSFTPYIRLMYQAATRRFGSDFDPGDRALSLGAHARASLADRRFPDAVNKCRRAVEEAESWTSPAIERACKALLVRALLLVGRSTEALEDIGDLGGFVKESDPTLLRAEGLLTLGLAMIIVGDITDADATFIQLEAACNVMDVEGMADWYRTMALAGRGHAAFRGSRPAEALEPLDAALDLVRENGAGREEADLVVMRSVCAFASGDESARDGLAGLPDLCADLEPVNGAVDLLVGAAADMGGRGTSAGLIEAWYGAVDERATAADAHGFVQSVVALAGILSCDDAIEESRRVIDSALDALGTAGGKGLTSMLMESRAALGLA